MRFALSKKVDLWLFIIFCALFLFLFRDFFFKANTFYERDFTLLEIPLRKHAAALLKQGHLALWTEAHGNGQPFMANPKTAIFYPTTWLYLILPFFVAFKIHYLIHPLIGWLGMYLLAGTYGLSKKAAFFSASLFFFSGIYLSSFEFYNHIAAIAWMMWALYLHRLNVPIKSPKFIISILAWVLLILSGAPEFIIITGILALAQCFIETQKFKESFLKLAIAVLLACLISAAQILPALEMLSQTDRTSQAEIWPLELIQLLNLVFPGILGDDRSPGRNDFWGGHLFNRGFPLYYSFYIGFGSLILSILGLFFRMKKHEKILIILAFLFFIISCGWYSPFFYLYRQLPIFSSIRYPVKYLIGTFVCLCLLSGGGLQKLSFYSFRRFLNYGLVAFSVSLWLIFFLFKPTILYFLFRLFVIEEDSSKNNLINSILIGLIALSIYSILLFFSTNFNKKREIFIFIFIAFCFLDLIYHNKYINPTIPETFFDRPSLLKNISIPLIIYREETSPFSQLSKKPDKRKAMSYYFQSLFPFSGIGYGIKYVLNRDFINSYPSSQRALIDNFFRLPKEEKLRILTYLGCHFYIGSKPFINSKKAKQISIEGFPIYIEELCQEEVGPILIFNFIQVTSTQLGLKLFLNSNFDPKKIAIIESQSKGIEINQNLNQISKLPLNLNSDFKSLIKTVAKFPGYEKYIIETEKSGIIVFPGNWAPGWKAYLNKRKIDIFPANLFSKGIFLPEGRHLVILKYSPNSFVYGYVLSIIGILTCIIISKLSIRF
ncbi:MAG: YfhO family protein [Candidatus Aminicenantes bacterium]|nr:YfhO family protein [Candidatus Aminicenantes bacterium]